MAVTDNRTLLDNANAVTNWGTYPADATAPNVEADTVKFGSASMALTADNTGGTEGICYDELADRDWSGDVVYLWVNIANPGLMETKGDGGIKVRVANNAGISNFAERFLDGSDTYTGGWKMYVIDMDDVCANPDLTGGTPPVVTALQYVGIVVDLITGAMPKMQDNLFMDICWRLNKGTPGIIFQDGTFDWADAVLAGDEFDLTKAWGHIREESGDIRLTSSVQFGDDSGATTLTFADIDGRNVKFVEPNNKLPDDIYAVTVVGNTTGTTDVDFGAVVGTGDNRQGVGGTNWDTTGPAYTIDGETDIAHVDTVNFYGGSVTRAGVCSFSGATKTDLIGVTFTECGEVQTNDSEFLNSFIVSPSDLGAEMLTTHDNTNITCVAGTNVNEVSTFVTRTNQESTAGGSSANFTHTVAAGQEDVGLLVLFGFEHSSITTLGVTYGGVGSPAELNHSLQRIGTVSFGTTITVEAWFLANPPEGVANNVTINWSGSISNLGVSAYNLEGVGRFSEFAVFSNTATAATAVATTATNQSTSNLTVGMVYVDVSGPGTTFVATAGDATESRDTAVGAAAAYATAEDTAGVGDRVHDWTWTGSANAAHLVVQFKSVGLEHAIHMPTASDYTITYDNILFFGFGAAGTPKWHGLNSGLNADVTVAASNGSNPDQDEFEETDGGTTVVTNAVTVTVMGVTEGAAVSVIADETVGTITAGDVIFELLADSNGDAEITDFNYEGAFEPSGLDVLIRGRQQGIPNGALADDNGTQVDETAANNNNTNNTVTLLPVTPVVNEDRYLWGHAEQFGRIKVHVSTAGTGGFTITWQYWNGAWTNLAGVTDGTNSFANLGRNEVSFTIPGDWAVSTETGVGPFFFIRAAYTAGSVTITPLARKATLDVTRYIPTGDQLRTITSVGLATTVPWVVDTISSF